MSGWVKLHRKLTENPLWTCEPFTRGQAWVDLILLTNYADNFFYKRGVKVDVSRGQCAWSELPLSKRWQWSRNKVRKFLNDLEKEQQIIQQKNNVTQILTLVNYEEHQEKRTTDETPKGQQKDTKGTLTRMNKNDKNEKNIYKEQKFDFKKSLIELKIESDLVEDWLKVRKTKKAANTKTAFERIKKEIELSGLSANECIKIATERSWQGFNHKWLDNETNRTNLKSRAELQVERNMADLEERLAASEAEHRR